MDIASLAGRILIQQGQQNYPGPWEWHYNMMGGGWGIFMFMFMFLFWALIIVGIILLVRFIFPVSSSKASDDALEILKSRYARGEIQKAEFEEKKKDLAF